MSGGDTCCEEKNPSYGKSEWWWPGWELFEAGWCRTAADEQNSERGSAFPLVILIGTHIFSFSLFPFFIGIPVHSAFFKN